VRALELGRDQQRVDLRRALRSFDISEQLNFLEQ
jgi:hypothetical protein